MENNITDVAKIKQQTIEKVCEWLIQNGDNYISSIFDHGKPEIHYLRLELINDLKKAMEK